MSRWTIILLLLIVALSGLVYWVVTKEDKSIKKLSYERSFGIEDASEINKIFLAHRSGETFKLEKKGGTWEVNDSFEVFAPSINIFLATLENIEVKYTPPSTAVEQIKRGFISYGIKTELYGKNDRHLKTFYIGGLTKDERGTYAIMEGSENPFVVHIPFFEGNLRSRFAMKLKDWRNRFLFQEELEDISRVTIDYPRAVNFSFSLGQNEGNYSLERVSEKSGEEPLKRGVAEAYLHAFEKIGCEAFENGHVLKDSISQLIPYATLTLEKKDGKTKWIKLYPINEDTGKVDLSPEYLGSGKPFRYFGVFNDEDFVLIQQLTIGNALKTYQWFADRN